MTKTFEELHPEIVQLIADRQYETSIYERREFGVLKEYWEKDENGVWQDKTQEKLNAAKSKELLRKLYRELAKINKELGEDDDGDQD